MERQFVACSNCLGTGYEYQRDDKGELVTRECPLCHEGHAPTVREGEICKVCNGQKRVETTAPAPVYDTQGRLVASAPVQFDTQGRPVNRLDPVTGKVIQ
jgi:DnaJ-class molecular chaperone